MTTTAAQEALRAGDPAAALEALQQQVRGDASNPKLRVFLFQLLAVMGQWPRAVTQLELCGELDPAALAMVQTYRAAIECEAQRDLVFAGKTAPPVLQGGASANSDRPGAAGRPEPWVTLLIQALAADGQGDGDGAFALRAQAMDTASARPGRIGERGFEWLADADSRLGPVLEVIVAGRYAWLPLHGLAKVEIEPPADLRDVVWAPAKLHFAGGGGTVALLPARYPGTASSRDGGLLLGRRTEWVDIGHDQYRGLGQKLLATDQHEVALFDVREIVFDLDDEGPSTMACEI